jgi:hypothetical protein
MNNRQKLESVGQLPVFSARPTQTAEQFRVYRCFVGSPSGKMQSEDGGRTRPLIFCFNRGHRADVGWHEEAAFSSAWQDSFLLYLLTMASTCAKRGGERFLWQPFGAPKWPLSPRRSAQVRRGRGVFHRASNKPLATASKAVRSLIPRCDPTRHSSNGSTALASSTRWTRIAHLRNAGRMPLPKLPSICPSSFVGTPSDPARTNRSRITRSATPLPDDP